MLQKFFVSNYRNLAISEPLHFTGLNIFIGPNGAGKSNLFEALKFLPDSFQNGLHKAFLDRRGPSSVLNKNLTLPNELLFKWIFSPIPAISRGINIEYLLNLQIFSDMSFAIQKEALQEERPRRSLEQQPWKYMDFSQGHGVVNVYDEVTPRGFEQKDTVSPSELAIREISSRTSYPALYQIRSEISSWAFYNGNNMSINLIQDRPAEIDPLQYHLSSTGENLAIMMFNLISRDEAGFESALHRTLTALCDDFEDLKFPLLDSNHIEMRWKSRNIKTKPLTLKELSDGTIRMLCWIAVLTHPSPSPLICIDEPELGIHPAWIPILADLIKSAARKTQVIIATHSPDLLDHFSDSPDNVVVTETGENGMAIFRRLCAEELTEWLQKYRLGELYRRRESVLGGWPY